MFKFISHKITLLIIIFYSLCNTCRTSNCNWLCPMQHELPWSCLSNDSCWFYWIQ